MKFERVKKVSEIQLEGITIEVDQTDSTINHVTLTDAKGNLVRFGVVSFNFVVEVPAKPKTVKRFQVEGTVVGAMMVPEVYEYLSMAQDRVNTLRRETEVHSLQIVEVDVLEAE